MHRLGHAVFDPVSGELRSDRAIRHLTPSESAILAGLIRLATGRIVQRSVFLDMLWSGRRDPPEDKTFEVQLHRLRRKLAEAEPSVLIETIWGVGWRLVTPDAPEVCPMCGGVL